MQRSRRTNPYPFTWEIPLALTVAVLLMLVIGAQVGRSVANLFAGNGWAFVDRTHLFTSLVGIVHGDADAGLASLTHPAGVGQLWASIAVVELIVIAACLLALTSGLHRWGPGRMHGVATPSEAEALLGRTKLRKHAKVIRPDLYGAGKGRRR